MPSPSRNDLQARLDTLAQVHQSYRVNGETLSDTLSRLAVTVQRLSERLILLENERDALREALQTATHQPTLLALRGYCLSLQTERDHLAEALQREIALAEQRKTA